MSALPPEAVQFIGAAIGGAVGAFTASLTFYRKKMRRVAHRAATDAVEEHERRCQLGQLAPAVTPAMGTPSPFQPWRGWKD